MSWLVRELSQTCATSTKEICLHLNVREHEAVFTLGAPGEAPGGSPRGAPHSKRIKDISLIGRFGSLGHGES